MTRYLLPLLALVIGAPSHAQPQELNLFGNPFSFQLPSGWKQASFEERSDMVSAEFVPERENLNQWGGLICIQSFKIDSEGPTAEQFLDTLASQYSTSCEGEASYEKLGGTELDGHQGFHGILGCSRMPNTHQSMEAPRAFSSTPEGEVGYYTVFQRQGQLVLMHKSMRGQVFGKQNIPLTPVNHREFIASVLPLRLR